MPPVIVCADADIDKAVAATIPYKFTSAGQSCVAPSRFYVHESLYADCLARFAATAAAITVGDGSEAGVRMGPLATRRRLEAMDRFVRRQGPRAAKSRPAASGAAARAGSTSRPSSPTCRTTPRS